MDWIEKYNLNFQLHIKEEDSNIYDQLNSDKVIGDMSTHNGTIVDVVSVSKINGSFYYKIKYKNQLIGWFNPKADSIKYFKTKKQEIKLLEKSKIDNELNNSLEIDTIELKENWMKIFTSDFCAIFNEKIYCGVLLKDKLLGFIEINDISHFINYRNDFNFINDNINLYKDSKLEKSSIENFSHSEKKYTALGGFEGFDGIRVIINGKRYWIDQRNTNINVNYPRITNIDDIIIDTLLYQLNDKVEKQNEFYSARINKLKEKNAELIQREKDVKQSIKQFRELL